MRCWRFSGIGGSVCEWKYGMEKFDKQPHWRGLPKT